MPNTTVPQRDSRPRILVAEDDAGIALGLEDTLRFEGCDVHLVTNGAAASRRALEEPFDLILLDVMMPGCDGFEVCRQLRTAGSHVPIVFLTARAQEADKVAGLDLGANDYIVKPFSPRELVARVRGLLRFVADSRVEVRHLEAELRAAALVQQRLFPMVRPHVDGFDYASECRAARGVSGDYYDFIALPSGRLAVLVADVCGKGMAAALLAAALQAAVRASAPDLGACCGELLARVNRQLFETTTAERFATVFYAVYDPIDRVLTWSNAGHCPPFLLRAASGAARLDSLTPPVGLLPEIEAVDRQVVLAPGDRLLAFSDGVTEACSQAGVEFGDARLARLAGALDAPTASATCGAVLEAVRAFSAGSPQSDDLTVLAAHVHERRP
jgi:serine phosphatase RsbU (regulator of sigma subunit)